MIEIPDFPRVTAVVDPTVIWTYSFRTLTRLTGMPRADLLGVDSDLATIGYTSERAALLDNLNIAEKIAGVGVLEVPANSGGIVLSSGQVVAVSIKALAKNSGDIYVGGDEDGTRPYSGHGICLEPGEPWNIEVKNLNAIRLVAVISGDSVTWAALK